MDSMVLDSSHSPSEKSKQPHCTYTSRFNRRHKLFGHLFSGRYKSLIEDGSGSGYLKSVGDYIHLNPARAKLVAADAPSKSFAWSSWPAYLLAPSNRPAWLRVDRLLGAWGIPKDSPAGRQRLERALEERRGAEEGEEFKPIRRGLWLGEEKFREELLAQMSERMGAETTIVGGVDRRASGDGPAQLSEPSLVSPEEAGRGVANIKN